MVQEVAKMPKVKCYLLLKNHIFSMLSFCYWLNLNKLLVKYENVTIQSQNMQVTVHKSKKDKYKMFSQMLFVSFFTHSSFVK